MWGLLVIFILFSLIGCSQGSDQDELLKPTVTVEITKTEPLIIEKHYEAVLELDEEQVISASTSGYLRQFFCNEGSQVNPGESLALLENEAILVTNQRWEHEVELAQIQLAKNQMQAEEAKQNKEKKEILFDNGAISQQELDQSILAWQLSNREMEQAQERWELSIINQKESQDNKNNCIVKATDKLWIVEELVQIGQFVNKGEAIFKAGKKDKLIMRLELPRDEIQGLEIGDQLKVSYQGDVKVAEIININQLAHPGSQHLAVELKIDNSSLDWLPGTVAQAKYTRDMGEQLLIPIAAIAKGKEPYVYIVKDAKVYREPINLGLVVGKKVSVTGLENGTILVTEGLHRLRDGEIVNIKEGL